MNNFSFNVMKILMTMLLSLAFFPTMYAQVEIIAHRGASFLAPENTVASSKLAWEKGADAVECDIYLSKDNKIMCSHDSNTKRTTGQDLNIKETDSGTLRKLDAGSFKDQKYKGESIPILDELIKEVPNGKELVVEIKCGSEVLPFLQKAVAKAGKRIRFAFIAFDLNTITETKKSFSETSCYWLCSNPVQLVQNLKLIPAAGLEGVSLSYNLINENVAQEVRNLGLELFAWTVDDPDEAKRLITLGVKGITTNRPDLIREKLF